LAATPAGGVSFDDGATWLATPVRRAPAGESGEWVVTVDHPASAGDDRGNTAEQTVIQAYELVA
jgi:hypothetical protein